jgi:predicted NAD-dependent protein-ADP-ribosyltransferase YbiA (DUF1768 family)
MSKFMYFSKSADAAPGNGACEELDPDDDFTELAEINNWRRQLSNFHIAPFELDGLTWNSVEHFYQASKFKENNLQFYQRFSIESGSDFCLNPVKAKGAGGKSGKSQGVLLRPVAVLIDPNFFNGIDESSMRRALQAKFEQNDYLCNILLLTSPAQLWHKTRGIPLTRMHGLEAIRDDLVN